MPHQFKKGRSLMVERRRVGVLGHRMTEPPRIRRLIDFVSMG